MLKKDGKLDSDPIIKNGSKRTLTEEEQQVFDLIRGDYCEGSALPKSYMNESLKKDIFDSTFLKDYFLDFESHRKIKTLTETKEGINTTYILDSDFNETQSNLAFGPGMFFVSMAGQWKRTQMIPHIDWKGTLIKAQKNNQIFVDPEQPTLGGICTWIAPLSKYVDNKTVKWPKGAISGENNGLKMLLDTESYDYVENDRGGVGFKISVVHPLEMPIIEQSGISVQPGTSTQLAVSATLITTSESAITRFSPYERKCWTNSEIDFGFIPYEDYYHYSMSNCLFEAAMQEANRTCHCIPGYIKPSDRQCFGKKLKCFKGKIENLGK